MLAFIAALSDPIWCEPPFAPYPYTAAEAAEFREDIKAEYERYVSELEAYLACLTEERTRAMAEGRQQVERYNTFLKNTPLNEQETP